MILKRNWCYSKNQFMFCFCFVKFNRIFICPTSNTWRNGSKNGLLYFRLWHLINQRNPRLKYCIHRQRMRKKTKRVKKSKVFHIFQQHTSFILLVNCFFSWFLRLIEIFERIWCSCTFKWFQLAYFVFNGNFNQLKRNARNACQERQLIAAAIN